MTTPYLNKPDMTWVITGVLARAARPGYPADEPVETEIDRWIQAAKDKGIRGILCLLSQDELDDYYGKQGHDLIGTYKKAGFKVAQIPVKDHQVPALPKEKLALATAQVAKLPKPVLVHCSAGIDRTGAVLRQLAQSQGGSLST